MWCGSGTRPPSSKSSPKQVSTLPVCRGPSVLVRQARRFGAAAASLVGARRCAAQRSSPPSELPDLPCSEPTNRCRPEAPLHYECNHRQACRSAWTTARPPTPRLCSAQSMLCSINQCSINALLNQCRPEALLFFTPNHRQTCWLAWTTGRPPTTPATPGWKFPSTQTPPTSTPVCAWCVCAGGGGGGGRGGRVALPAVPACCAACAVQRGRVAPGCRPSSTAEAPGSAASFPFLLRVLHVSNHKKPVDNRCTGVPMHHAALPTCPPPPPPTSLPAGAYLLRSTANTSAWAHAFAKFFGDCPKHDQVLLVLLVLHQIGDFL